MTNKEEWNEFLDNLFSNALKAYQDTKECKFIKEKQEQINSRIAEQQNAEQDFLENCAFEMGLDAERKTEFIYRQGVKDCVFILKSLGVLA